MTLETEQDYFARNKEELLKHHEGKFALISGESLIGIWDSQERAYREGVVRFGNVSFLIKQVLKVEPVESIPLLLVGEVSNAHLP